MSLGHLLLDADLFFGGHQLPLTGFDQQLHPVFDRIRFRDEKIGTSRKCSKGIAGAGIPGEHNHAARRVETIGIRLVLAGSRALMKIKMTIFDGRHFDIGVLVNHSGPDIMTEEQLAYRYRTAAVGNPDLSTNAE